MFRFPLFWYIIFDYTCRGSWFLPMCVSPLSFQSHLIGFEVFNLFSCLCLVQVVSCDLSRSTFRTASPHYPAVLSLLVTSLPCTALQGYINAMVWWSKKKNSHQQLILLIVSSRLIEGAGHCNRLARSLLRRIMTLQTHSEENQILCKILYFSSQLNLWLILSSCSLTLLLNQDERGT